MAAKLRTTVAGEDTSGRVKATLGLSPASRQLWRFRHQKSESIPSSARFVDRQIRFITNSGVLELIIYNHVHSTRAFFFLINLLSAR